MRFVSLMLVSLLEKQQVRVSVYSIMFTEMCGECTTGDIRLVNPNSTSRYEGRVEVCVEGCWGTVTSRNWYFADAMTACRHAGFATISKNTHTHTHTQHTHIGHKYIHYS